MTTFPEAIHNEAQSQFELVLPGGTAVCAYRRHGDVLALVHTETPWALQGQGAAAHLVGQVLAWARGHGLKVQPRCSYVASYLRRHPEHHDLLAD